MVRSADRHVLVVEDDLDASANIADILEIDGYTCDVASSIAEGLERLGSGRYGVIILDRKLPDGQSIESLPRIRKLAPDAAIIVVTGYADLDGAVQALRSGASDYILKPINPEALRATLERIRDMQASEAEISRLNRDLGRRQAELNTLLNVFPSEFSIAIADDPLCKYIHVSESFARTLNIPATANASLYGDEPGRAKFCCTASGRELAPEELPVQQSALYGKVIQGAELDVVRSDGTAVHLLCYSSPLYDERGETRGAIGAFLDITERRKAAQALEQSEQRFHAIFDNSMDGLIVMDDQSRITDANPAACANLGLTEDGMKGRRLSELLRCDDSRGFQVHWQELFAAGHTRGQCQALHSDGHIVDIEFHAAANFMPGLHVISIRDVTERKRAEQRSLQSERLAAIGETMAALAHESRNALQRSRACLEMLSLEVEHQPDAIDLVQRVLKAQDRLQELYEEVREYAAPIKLDVRPVDLQHVWRTAWNHVIEAHPEKHLDLVEDVTVDQCRCAGDRYRLEQVLLNIFENAQQVSPPHGTIRVRCSAGAIGDRPAVQVAIRDDGPGMSREQRERIFEAFFTTKTRGTGLGMAIVLRIVHAHGGRIEVADRDGPGAEILLTLPAARP